MYKSLLSSLLLAGSLSLIACGSGSGGSSSNPPPVVPSSSQAAISSSSSAAVSSSSSSESATSGLRELVTFPVGVAVNAGNETLSLFKNTDNGNNQRAIVEQHFSQLTAGNIMKMSYLHPGENTFYYSHADALVEYAHEHNISIHGHALIWHSDYQVPGWMKSYPGDWSDMLKIHVQTIAGHFAGKVASWDVVNEAFLDDGNYRNLGDDGSIFYQKMGKAYIEEAFVNARAADGIADLYYNDYSLENDGRVKLDAVLAMVDDFQSRNIPIDGIGFQMHTYLDWPSISTIRTAFQQVVDRNLKVKITELDIPINNPYSGSYNFPDNYHPTLTPTLAAAQKRRYCEIVAAYMDVVPEPLRGGITVWGIWDSDSWLINQLFQNNHDDWPLLFDDFFQPKPAFFGVEDGLGYRPCS